MLFGVHLSILVATVSLAILGSLFASREQPGRVAATGLVLLLITGAVFLFDVHQIREALVMVVPDQRDDLQRIGLREALVGSSVGALGAGLLLVLATALAVHARGLRASRP